MMSAREKVKTTLSFNGGPEFEVDLDAVKARLDRHDALRSYVDRLVKLHEEKAELAAEIKDLAEKAKGDGFSKKAIMVLVHHQLETSEQRAERIAVADEVDRMRVALGMFLDTPLGASAVARAEAA